MDFEAFLSGAKEKERKSFSSFLNAACGLQETAAKQPETAGSVTASALPGMSARLDSARPLSRFLQDAKAKASGALSGPMWDSHSTQPTGSTAAARVVDPLTEMAREEARRATSGVNAVGKRTADTFTHKRGKFPAISAVEIEDERKAHERQAAAFTPTADMYLNPHTAAAADEMQKIADQATLEAVRDKNLQEKLYGDLNRQRRATNKAFRTANAFLPREAGADYEEYLRQYDIAAEEDAKLRAMGGAADRTILPSALGSEGAGFVNAGATILDFADRYGYFTDEDDWMNTAPESETVKKMHDLADTLSSKSAQNLEGVKAGRGRTGNRLINAAFSGIQMVGDAVANMIAPGSGLALMGVRAFGNSAQDARLRGATTAQQLGYGAAVAAVEVISEKLFDGLAGIYGGGVADEVVEQAISKLASSDGGRRVLTWLASGLMEMGEEWFSGAVDPALQSIFDKQKLFGSEHYNRDTLSDIIEDGIVGFLLGSSGGAVDVLSDVAANAETEAQQTNAQLRQRAQTEAATARGTVAQSGKMGYTIPEQNAGKENLNGDFQRERGENASGSSGAQAEAGDRPGVQREKREAQGTIQQEAVHDRARGLNVAEESSQSLSDYGAKTHIVRSENWTHSQPAYTKNGEVYMREDIPEAYRGMIAPHEGTHIMRQTSFQPYLDFVDRTPEMMNVHSDGFAVLLQSIAENRGIDPLDLSGQDIQKLYDELNATVYGHLASRQYDDAMLSGLKDAFRDLDRYFKELDGIHTYYKQSHGNGKTDGGANSGEGTDLLHGGGERADGARAAEQVRGMEEAPGRDPGGNGGGQNAAARPADGGAADLAVGEKISTASLGLPDGSTTDAIYEVVGGDTACTKKARQIAADRGLTLHLFKGGNLHFQTSGEARGYINGRDVYVRADHALFTADKIMLHESGHDMVAKGEIDLNTVRDRVSQRYGVDGAKKAAELYASAYDGMTADEAWEELVCDSIANMNIFSGTLDSISEKFQGMLNSVKAATEYSNIQQQRDPSSKEGKASRERHAQRGRPIELETMENNRFERLRQFRDDLPPVWYAYSGENFYAYRNNSFMDYSIISKIPLTEENKSLIDAITKEIEDNAFRTSEDYRRRLKTLRDAARRRGSDDAAAANGRPTVEDGQLSGNGDRQSADENGDIQRGSGDSRKRVERLSKNGRVMSYDELADMMMYPRKYSREIAKRTDLPPSLYDLAYAMYTGESDRLYRELNAMQAARGDGPMQPAPEMARDDRERMNSDPRVDREEESAPELPVDYLSILDLGYGPVSASRLRELIELGEVETYVADGKIRFRRVNQTE